MDLRWAQLSIGGLDYQAELDPEGSMASFSVDLELGEDQVQHSRLRRACLPVCLAACVVACVAGWLADRLQPVYLPALVLLCQCGCMHSHVNNVLPDLKGVTLNSAHTVVVNVLFSSSRHSMGEQEPSSRHTISTSQRRRMHRSSSKDSDSSAGALFYNAFKH